MIAVQSLPLNPLIQARNTAVARLLARQGTSKLVVDAVLESDELLDQMPIQLEDIAAVIDAWRAAGGEQVQMALPMNLTAEIEALYLQVLGLRSSIKHAAAIRPMVEHDDTGVARVTVLGTPFVLRMEPGATPDDEPMVVIETAVLPSADPTQPEVVTILKTSYARLQFWLTSLIVNWTAVRLHDQLRSAIQQGEDTSAADIPNPWATREDIEATLQRVLFDDALTEQVDDLRHQARDLAATLDAISKWPWPLAGQETKSLASIRTFARQGGGAPATGVRN